MPSISDLPRLDGLRAEDSADIADMITYADIRYDPQR